MPVVGVGIDVVDVARFGESLERTPALRERLGPVQVDEPRSSRDDEPTGAGTPLRTA